MQGQERDCIVECRVKRDCMMECRMKGDCKKYGDCTVECWKERGCKRDCMMIDRDRMLIDRDGIVERANDSRVERDNDPRVERNGLKTSQDSFYGPSESNFAFYSPSESNFAFYSPSEYSKVYSSRVNATVSVFPAVSIESFQLSAPSAPNSKALSNYYKLMTSRNDRLQTRYERQELLNENKINMKRKIETSKNHRVPGCYAPNDCMISDLFLWKDSRRPNHCDTPEKRGLRNNGAVIECNSSTALESAILDDPLARDNSASKVPYCKSRSIINLGSTINLGAKINTNGKINFSNRSKTNPLNSSMNSGSISSSWNRKRDHCAGFIRKHLIVPFIKLYYLKNIKIEEIENYFRKFQPLVLSRAANLFTKVWPSFNKTVNLPTTIFLICSIISVKYQEDSPVMNSNYVCSDLETLHGGSISIKEINYLECLTLRKLNYTIFFDD